MKNNLTKAGARYFVLEPKATRVTEITSPLGEECHCLKAAVTPTHQVRLSLYCPKRVIERATTPYEQGLYIWDTLDNLLKKVGGWATPIKLPYQIRGALFDLRDRTEEHYFWKPKDSNADWETPQFTPVKNWREFTSDFSIDKITHEKNDRDDAVTHFRLDLVIPKPWHKDLKRSMLLWTPGGKTPRRYDISGAETTDDIDEKLKKSGFNIRIPWSFKGSLRKNWPFTFLRLYLQP